ncbi:MAG TPA: Rpn family recombination-promoting nuclease/putative transposase [Candidatus Anaerobiospirillum pullistercoris]|uniref:Rpn family recombination-promoting nuclease/putative transposase n=1 Tax=Candidatus Anaerobiospirillum pullistercoris TaxID=2838452 RepID=A0A9D2B1T4_9GAMM|nr:Rpn family recombination-promoting nuclease/putative transposase [Candidatus Anaerobiospirillum pullistercoris]
MWHPATNKVITDLQILHFIEIPKFERMQEQKKQQGVAMSRLDRWLQYLTCSDPQEVLAFAKADAIFGKVLEAEKMYINDKELIRKYYEENSDGYWEGVIANAKAEERQTLLAAARTLLAEGMDRLKVQRVMQLTDAEMASIC